MQPPEPAATADLVASLTARLEAAERALAARDETIQELVNRQSTFGVLEDNAGLQRAVALKTEELEAQNRKLEQSEERFSNAFEHAPIGVALVSPDGRWLKVNRAVCELVGYSEVELLAGTFQDITHPEDLHVDLENVRRLIAGEAVSYQIEKRYVHRRGHLVAAVLNVSLVRDGQGQPLYFISQIQDITARKRSEAELQWKNTLLEAQVDSSLDGILVVDNQGRQILKNGRFNEVWKIPRHIADDHDDQKTLQFVIDQIKNPKQFLEKVTYLYSHPDEISRDEIGLIDGTFLDRYSAPVRDKSGKLYGRIWTFRDVTASKRAQAELENVHDQLLETSRQAGMAEVATSVLHNVGNVLNSVNISATLVSEGVRKSKADHLGRVVALLDGHAADLGAFLTSDPQGRNLPAYLRQLHERLSQEQAGILREIEALRGNIEHIKEIVAMQQNYARVSGVTERLEVPDLVEDALRMNSSSLSRHDIHVVREFEKVATITADKHKLLQILVNLMRNAKQACDDSGRTDKQLTLRLTNGSNRIRIAVSDNGVGISSENLTRIFAHGFTTKKGGHGFGLHGSALAARELGGSLQVHSDGAGHGATFTLELPVTPGPKES